MGTPDWARDYFERGYGQRWELLPPSDKVRREVETLWGLLRLAPESRVIDIGCGHGRHALALAERGARVVGLDFADTLLSRAREISEAMRTRARWVRGDMRRLPFRGASADGAMVIDAFGFFDTEAENEAVLQEAARVLTVGGRLVMKVLNGGLVLDDFRDTEREERDGVTIEVSNTLTLEPPRLTQRIRIRGAQGAAEYGRRQRLYRVEELRAALEDAGLTVTGVHSRADGTPFDPATSPAIWILAQRRQHAGVRVSA